MRNVNANEAAAEWVPVNSLRPWHQNPRQNDAAVDQVAASIRRFGWGTPIIARRADGTLIAGHTRHKAALKLGLDRVPVRFLDLDPADAHLLALADNKTAELAEWDEEVLGAVLAALAEDDLNLTDGTGFTDAEIERLVAGVGEDLPEVAEDDGGDPDAAEELLAKWKVEPGQLWTIPSVTTPGKAHRLLCGDSRDPADVARLFGNDRAAWMWTDPPYGVSYQGKTKDALTIQNDGADHLPDLLARAFGAADAVLVEGAPIYVCHPTGPLALAFGSAFVSAGWHLHQQLVWIKDAMVLGHSDYQSKHEGLLYGWKGKNRPWHGGRDQVTTLEVERPKASELHPTSKPLKLIEATLKNSSRRGELGYEPFAGSGSTYAASEQLGRLVAGIEIEKKYCAVVLERMAGAGLTPTLNDG